MKLRRALHALGFRYRLHGQSLPGTPDLVFPGRRKVIFVNGCFWHSHDCKAGRVVPKTNADSWELKRRGTKTRDRRNRAELELLGWSVLAVWECELLSPSTVIATALWLDAKADKPAGSDNLST